jgi:Tfp pilus assembly protein PilN
MHARLNLATTPLVGHRRFYVGSALFGFLAAVLCVWLALRFHDVRKAEEAYRLKADKLQSEMNHLLGQRASLQSFFNQPENRNLQDREKFLDQVMEGDSFNWTKMFMDLEHTLPAGVRVVRIEPKLEHGIVSVKFEAGASSPDAKLELFRAFEESPSFSHFVLYSENVPRQMTNTTDALILDFSVIYTGI